MAYALLGNKDKCAISDEEWKEARKREEEKEARKREEEKEARKREEEQKAATMTYTYQLIDYLFSLNKPIIISQYNKSYSNEHNGWMFDIEYHILSTKEIKYIFFNILFVVFFVQLYYGNAFIIL